MLSSLLGQTVRQKDGELPADHPCQAAKRKLRWVYNPPDQIMTVSKRAGGIFLHSGEKFHLSCAVGKVGLWARVVSLTPEVREGNRERQPCQRARSLSHVKFPERSSSWAAGTVPSGNKGLTMSHMPRCKTSENSPEIGCYTQNNACPTGQEIETKLK